MALTESDQWFTSVQFQDRDKNIGTMSFYIPGAQTYAQAYTLASNIATLALALSDAVLLSVQLSRAAYDPTVGSTTLPAETSDVERKGVFSFKGDSPITSTTVNIPSVNNIFVVDGSNIINPADPAVQAFILAITAGAGAGPVSIHGDDITRHVPPAKKVHRKSSKG